MNDVSYLPWALALLPVAFAFHAATRPRDRALSRVGLAFGVLGMLLAFVAQALLALRALSIEQNTPLITSAFGLIGVWLVAANGLSRSGAIPASVSRLGLATGSVWAAAGPLIWLGGYPQEVFTAASPEQAFTRLSPLSLAGFLAILLGTVAQPLWALWLARSITRTRASAGPPRA